MVSNEFSFFEKNKKIFEENLIGDAAMSDAEVYNVYRIAVEHVGKKEW